MLIVLEEIRAGFLADFKFWYKERHHPGWGEDRAFMRSRCRADIARIRALNEIIDFPVYILGVGAEINLDALCSGTMVIHVPSSKVRTELEIVAKARLDERATVVNFLESGSDNDWHSAQQIKDGKHLL